MIYIIWNNTKTEGYATTDPSVAYEARKGAGSNCFDKEGNCSELAQAFCEIYSENEDCTIQELNQ